MSTYGTSSHWTPASDHDEPASEGPDYRASADSATAEPDGAGEDTGDAALPGQAGHDVVVVESVHTGDQGSAYYGAGASEASDPAFRTTATSSTATGSTAEWSEIKALFVDDPSASVSRASALVERAVDGFMASLRQRQDALSSWQEGDATGTEDLRVALRGYRDLFGQLERMSGQFPAQSGGQPPGGQVGAAVS